jgi:hypothetical protein
VQIHSPLFTPTAIQDSVLKKSLICASFRPAPFWRDFELGTQRVYDHLKRFGLQKHVGRGAEASKTEAMFFPSIDLA